MRERHQPEAAASVGRVALPQHRFKLDPTLFRSSLDQAQAADIAIPKVARVDLLRFKSSVLGKEYVDPQQMYRDEAEYYERQKIDFGKIDKFNKKISK